MSICFIPEWKTELCTKAINPWLSPFSGIIIGFTSFDLLIVNSLSLSHLNTKFSWMARTFAFCSETLIKACSWSGYRRPSLVSSNYSHIAFFAANVNMMYLAFMDDKATVASFLEH